MYLNAYAVYDSGADLWNSPFFMRTQAEAVRAFGSLSQDLKTQIGQHPGDFVLYFIGTYDDNSGRMEALDEPQVISVAADLLKPPSEDVAQLDSEGLQ